MSGLSDIFSMVRHRLGGLNDYGNDVAMTVVVKHVACPYCNSVHAVMALGPIRRRVDRRMTVNGGVQGEVPNPGFRETHLANPIACPACGRRYILFVGVERNGYTGDVKGVDVKVAKPDDPFVDELSRWPHKGLVAREVLEYTPGRVFIYDDIKHFEEYNREAGAEEVIAASLPNNLPSAKRGVEVEGRPPRVMELNEAGKKRSIRAPVYI